MKTGVVKVGYENLDSLAAKEALESFKAFNVDEMAKFTYGPKDRRGTRDFALYQVQGGKIVRVTDYLEAPILVP